MHAGAARPLIGSVSWAAGAYLAAVGLQVGAGAPPEISFRALAAAVAGALYTNVFEHAWHRFGMHGRRPDPRHARHHRLFYGDRFRTADPEAMREIVTSWYIFPALLAVHDAAFVLIFGSGLAPAFFLGVTVHFIAYEVTHWFTHIEGNSFDRWVAKLPGLRRLRAIQVEHHRLHHMQPLVNFNFNPPYAGDWIFRVLRR